MADKLRRAIILNFNKEFLRKSLLTGSLIDMSGEALKESMGEAADLLSKAEIGDWWVDNETESLILFLNHPSFEEIPYDSEWPLYEVNENGVMSKKTNRVHEFMKEGRGVEK